MKMSKCGIQAAKVFFFHPGEIEMYPDLSDSIYLAEEIDQCLCNANVN